MIMDGGGQNNLMTLIFLVAAVLIFLKLRSVLGRRTGDEPARFERYRSERAAAEAQAAAKAETKSESKSETKRDGKVVTLPRRDRDAAAEVAGARETDEARSQRMTQFAAGNSALARGLISVAHADTAFEPADFVRGAKAAYEAIVSAFAEGNRALLRELLSPDVFDDFAAVLDQRATRQETVEQSFIGIKSADIVDAELAGKSAQITVTFVSELISAIRNAAREVISGDPKRIKEVTDVWTFARDVTASNPNWHLVATRAAH